MGLPRFWGRVDAGEAVMGPELGESKRDEDMSQTSAAKELSIHWSISYYALLVVGAVSFYRYLWTLTESESALTIFK